MIDVKRETEHIIAFLDLLGASEMIASNRSETVLNIISYLFEKSASVWPHLGNAPDILHEIKCVTFSDNIAFSLDLSALVDKKGAIESFIKYISVFQCAALKSDMLFRGGIALGQLYMDIKNNFVWGKALVDAHILEEKVAIYPRVILSDQFKEFDPLNIPRVRQDFDGMYFVDYVPIANKIHPDWVEKGKHLIQHEFVRHEGRTGQEGVLQKYRWLQQYIELCEEEQIQNPPY